MNPGFKISALFLCLLLTSCSLKRAATSITADIISDGMRAAEAETDLWIAKESILPLVKMMEVLKEGDPENQKFLGLMSKAYGNIAFGFFEPRYLDAEDEKNSIWRARVERYYRLGYESGIKSLRQRFGDRIDGSVADFEAAIGKAKKKDLSALFWTAFDWGNLINMNKDDVTAIVNMPKVEALVDRVLKVDPDFGYGMAQAFKAALLASRPAMLGGRPDEAAQMFEKAVAASDGAYLMNRVMYAEWYAMPQGKKGVAKDLLQEVIGADATRLPEQRLANELAKERAQILLKKLR